MYQMFSFKIYNNYYILLIRSILSKILSRITGTSIQSGLGEELREYAGSICYNRKYTLVNRIR